MRTTILAASLLLTACEAPTPDPPPIEVKRFADIAQELGRPDFAAHQLYRATDPNHKPRIMMKPCDILGSHDGREAYGWFNGWGRIGCATLSAEHIIIDWGDGMLLKYPITEFSTCGENDKKLCRF